MRGTRSPPPPSSPCGVLQTMMMVNINSIVMVTIHTLSSFVVVITTVMVIIITIVIVAVVTGRIMIAMPNTNRTAAPSSDESDGVTVDQRRQQAAEMKTLSPDKVASAASDQVCQPTPLLQAYVHRELYLFPHVVLLCARYRERE